MSSGGLTEGSEGSSSLSEILICSPQVVGTRVTGVGSGVAVGLALVKQAMAPLMLSGGVLVKERESGGIIHHV